MDSPEDQRHWRRPFWMALAVALPLTGALAAVWWSRGHGSRDQGADPLAVVISGDTAGWIVPCGCTSNQSGGLLRRGTFVAQAAASYLADDARQLLLPPGVNGASAVVVADAGGAAGGTSVYHRLKFEAILRGELAMGLTAHNLGGPEAALGADYLRRVGRELGVPFVSANLRDERGQLLAEPIRIVERAQRRLALVGVIARRYAAEGWQVDEPAAAVLREATRARGRYDSLIVLAYLPEDELRQLAASLPEADAVIGGPTGQSIKPQAVGPTLVGSATNKGKFLVVLTTSERQPRSRWRGAVVEMTDKYADDPAQEENVRGYLAELAQQDFPAEVSGFVPALPTGLPAGYKVAGNQACVLCHRDDCRLLGPTKHAHAWKSLTEKGFQVDSYCQQCHTTGYGQPAGFRSVKRTPALSSVGCESCHGPSLAHSQNPRVPTPFAARDQCITCHDRENSPKFGYDEYWKRIVHGKPAKVPTPARR